jgi:hypothetical protein
MLNQSTNRLGSPAAAASGQGMHVQDRYDEADASKEAVSGFGSRPGAEFPSIVYVSIVVAFAWMLTAAWLAFGGHTATDLDLLIVTVLCTVSLMLPLAIDHTNAARLSVHHPRLKEFFSSRLDTATGSLSAGEAWLQVALIPVGLAIAATLIGIIYVVFG